MPPPLPTSIHLHPAHFSLHPAQCSNQNIARCWAISPNLGRKIQNFLFCLKIGTHGISRMLILFPTLVFQMSKPKILFWANLGQKSESCQFCLKVGTHGISRKLIVIRTLVFWISNQKSILGKFGPKKSKLSAFSEYWHTLYLDDADSYFNICSLNFKPKTDFWPNLGQKSKFVHFVWKLAHMVSKGCGFLFRN